MVKPKLYRQRARTSHFSEITLMLHFCVYKCATLYFHMFSVQFKDVHKQHYCSNANELYMLDQVHSTRHIH